MMKSEQEYKVYPRRWAVLLCVCFVNMSNASVWISFFPVATLTADYFETTSSKINWFSSVFMIIPMLCFFITTYISNAKGLKLMVHIGCGFNFVGALIKAFGTSALVEQKNTQYTITLIGQCVAAVAQTFTIYVPTKVSQVWFPESERWIITIILSLSYSMGIILTELITPLVIKSSDEIPIIDYVCLAFAAFIQIFTLIFMTRSHPKTPPSKTAEKQMVPYLTQLKETFSSKEYVCLLFILSAGVGFIAAINTLTQQMICSVGYSNVLAGSLIFVMYGFGFIGSFIVLYMVERYNIHETVLKLFVGLFCLSYIGLCESLLIPNAAWALVLFYCFFGFSSVSLFPLGLELAVEATYPIDESITTGLMYLFGQVFAVIMIILIPLLAREDYYNEYNTCDFDADHTPVEYSISVSVAMLILCCIAMGTSLYYKPVFKRRDFERKEIMESNKIIEF